MMAPSLINAALMLPYNSPHKQSISVEPVFKPSLYASRSCWRYSGSPYSYARSRSFSKLKSLSLFCSPVSMFLPAFRFVFFCLYYIGKLRKSQVNAFMREKTLLPFVILLIRQKISDRVFQVIQDRHLVFTDGQKRETQRQRCRD